MKCTLGTSILIGCCLQLLLLYADALPPFITPEILEMVQSDKKRCMTEHGTTEAMIDNVNSGNMPNDRSITCYMYCMFEAFGMVDEEANVDIDIILTFIPEEYHKNSLETFNACNVKTDVTDVCDKLYELGSCILNKAPEMWFMV